MGGWGVSRAADNGQAGIFRETRIGDGELAEVKQGAAIGFNASRVLAVGAESCKRAINL